MEQVRNNTKEQAMLGPFPVEIMNTLVESLNINKITAYKALTNKEIAEGIASVIYIKCPCKKYKYTKVWFKEIHFGRLDFLKGIVFLN